MNLLNFSNLDVKLFKTFMDILKKLKRVRVYNVMLEDGYGVKEHKIVAPNGQYAIAQSVFVNIVVTQFNIKRLKPHWH